MIRLSATPQAPQRVPLLQADSLSSLPWLRHGFTTRSGGVSHVYGMPDDLNLGLTLEDDRAAVLENRRLTLARVAREQSAAGWALTQTRQVHSATILVLTPESLQPESPADGLVTSVPGAMLAVLAADCVPILLADARQRVVAAVHAGWRGTVEAIAGNAVQVMRERFGTNPCDVFAAVGPSIGPCCYQVGHEVHHRFHEAFPYAADLFAADHLNLWQANRLQLIGSGLPPDNITVLAACSACTRRDGRPSFFSHRAEDGRTGRMMGLIGIAPEPSRLSANLASPVA